MRTRTRQEQPGQDRKVPWKAEAGVFLAVALLGAGALGAVQPATGVPTEVLQLTQFGPAAGVLAVALLWPGRIRARLAGALRARRDTAWAGPGRRTGLPLLLTAPLIIALAAGTYALLDGDGDARLTDPRSLAHPFALIVLAQLIGACGEEIGWRCWLQPLLRTRFGPLAAPVAVGLLWGGWHVQVFAQRPAYAVGFLLGTVAMSVVLGLALEGVRTHRLLLAGGFHTLVNLGMLLTMDEEDGTVLPMVLLGGAALLAAVPWVLRARWGARPEDDREPSAAPGRIPAAPHGAR
ncbi:CPBP family intramembrane glutamic endopeptidase [Kitasatospora purpeofusca]|uniref:CPBP family intramembrane glutamic endopeptidase n=1 Tax=Kitasatospora purpeofusca TaxID=67352 RepID=UPI00224F7D5B|nr:CPBP family intramembrane glutamic endopeptidase [Kitasatospora purpeofusca]MCX4758451.1 CPBP family intramembrane metalloprotease [Kitasatospora purpeofusca]WSR31098.1 CPBP family intramembrane metalloprotease [Kitasatospora purpeofusca]